LVVDYLDKLISVDPYGANASKKNEKYDAKVLLISKHNEVNIEKMSLAANDKRVLDPHFMRARTTRGDAAARNFTLGNLGETKLGEILQRVFLNAIEFNEVIINFYYFFYFLIIFYLFFRLKLVYD
jgi:hypothetical protein